MATLNEVRGIGAFLVSEANGMRSREVDTIASGSGKLESGQLLGRLTVGGKLVPVDADADTGAETAVAVLYAAVDATSADVTDAVVIVRDAEVNGAELIADVAVAGYEADLLAAGIVIR